MRSLMLIFLVGCGDTSDIVEDSDDTDNAADTDADTNPPACVGTVSPGGVGVYDTTIPLDDRRDIYISVDNAVDDNGDSFNGGTICAVTCDSDLLDFDGVYEGGGMYEVSGPPWNYTAGGAGLHFTWNPAGPEFVARCSAQMPDGPHPFTLTFHRAI